MSMQLNGVFRSLSAPQYPCSSIPEYLVNLMCLLSWISISVCSGEQVYVGILWEVSWLFPILYDSIHTHSLWVLFWLWRHCTYSDRMVTHEAQVCHSDQWWTGGEWCKITGRVETSANPHRGFLTCFRLISLHVVVNSCVGFVIFLDLKSGWRWFQWWSLTVFYQNCTNILQNDPENHAQCHEKDLPFLSKYCKIFTLTFFVKLTWFNVPHLNFCFPSHRTELVMSWLLDLKKSIGGLKGTTFMTFFHWTHYFHVITMNWNPSLLKLIILNDERLIWAFICL